MSLLNIRFNNNSGAGILNSPLFQLNNVNGNIMKLSLKASTIQIRLKANPTIQNSAISVYLKLNFLGPSILNQPFGIPIHISSDRNTIYNPDFKITLSQNLPSVYNYSFVDNNGSLIDFTEIEFVEIVFNIEPKY